MIEVRDDVRLENGPMQPLTCQACGASVTVRKSTWDQTTVQWHADAVSACLERRASAPSRNGPNAAVFTGCSALRTTIREAAVQGNVQVLDDTH